MGYLFGAFSCDIIAVPLLSHLRSLEVGVQSGHSSRLASHRFFWLFSALLQGDCSYIMPSHDNIQSRKGGTGLASVFF